LTKEIGLRFMEETRFKSLGVSGQAKGLPRPPLEADYDRTKPIVDLPHPTSIKVKTVDLVRAVENRRSVRSYAEDPLTMGELSLLLWCTQGVKEVRGDTATLRTVPSAGARHAFATCLLVNRVQGIQPGLYRFLAVKHKLVAVSLDPGMDDKVTEACLNQGFVKTSAVTFIWVAVPYRMIWRYGERGYRYLHIDIGHVCQNLYLVAEALGNGVCAIGAFHDEGINEAIGIDGREQFVVYVATLGRKPTA
jgi:SagB-type dehydrogenase family enzyme